jgi:hypothetical protein
VEFAHRTTCFAASLAAGIALGACSDDEVETNRLPADYDLTIPTAWAPAVDNPLLPLRPGTTWRYETEIEDELEVVTVEVLDEKRDVNGVLATIVHDQVEVDGELVEDTFDWFAQDLNGNVWYLGEATQELEDGVVVGTEGSWEWGVGGALPGVMMWADPAAHLGEEYRQEYYPRVAEDWGKVVALDQTVEVPYASFAGCVQTEEWDALQPEVVETKYHCPNVGVVLEVEEDARVELVAFKRPAPTPR